MVQAGTATQTDTNIFCTDLHMSYIIKTKKDVTILSKCLTHANRSLTKLFSLADVLI